MFNNKEFGRKLKEIRKAKGYTQENVLKAYGVKDISTISRYENGDLILTIEQVVNVCNFMDISITSLFQDSNLIYSNSSLKNPFNTKTIYIYYKGRYPTSNRTAYLTFKIEIQITDSYIKLIEKDITTNKIYQIGTLSSNDSIAILDFRNYEPNSPTLSFGIITVHIGSSSNGIYKGNIVGTNELFIPSCRKCLISTSLINWNDEMKKELEYFPADIEEFKNTHILTTNIYTKEDYEE